MIKKWTVAFSPAAKKRLKTDWKWRESQGLQNALDLTGHFMAALVRHGFLDDRDNLEVEQKRWGNITKSLFVGWSENSDFNEAFHRGKRATLCIDSNVIHDGTGLIIVFHGRDVNGTPATWEFKVVFFNDGKLGFLSPGSGKIFPPTWAV